MYMKRSRQLWLSIFIDIIILLLFFVLFVRIFHSLFFVFVFEKIERSSQPTHKHFSPPLQPCTLTAIKMYTLEQLTKALPTLEEAFRTLANFHSLSIKPVCGAHSYYTDGEAQGAVAVLTIGRKNPKHVAGYIDLAKPDFEYCSLYIFPDGKIMTHFMKSDDVYTTTSQYVNCVGIWLALLE